MMTIASPIAVRNRLSEYSKRPIEISKGDKGFVIGKFNEILDQAKTSIELIPDQKRYLVWGYCFTAPEEQFEPIKSGELTDGQIFALKKWIGPFKDDNDDWYCRESFQTEARYILSVAEMIYRVDEVEPREFGKWIEGIGAQEIEIEPAGMVQSALDHMNGTITEYKSAPEEPPQKPSRRTEPIDGYIPL